MAKKSIAKNFTIKNVKNRIKELRYVKASELNANPKNWRKHPERQKSEMARILNDIGFAGALVAREDLFGSLVLIDGHMRADMAPEESVPVLVLDVTEYEADRLLAMMDPIAAMAETDKKAYDSLLEDLERADREAMKLLEDFNSKINDEIAINEEMYRREKEARPVGPELAEQNERVANLLEIPVVKGRDSDESHSDDDEPFLPPQAAGRRAQPDELEGQPQQNGFLGVMRPGSIERQERDPVMRFGRVLSPVPKPVYQRLLELLEKSYSEDVKAGLAEVLTLGMDALSRDHIDFGVDEDDVPF